MSEVRADVIQKMSAKDLLNLAETLRIPLTQRELSRRSLEELVVGELQRKHADRPVPYQLHDPAISMVGVWKTFGKKVAVEDLNLELRPGQILGLVGPNGAGKTTTLRILTGIIRADTGMVRVDGTNIVKSSVKAKMRIGYIPERSSCYANLRVREYLTFMGRIYRVPRHEVLLRISEYADLLQLGEFLDSYIGTLSKGNLQRTLLAGVFVRPPPFILALDEPFQGLDPRGAWVLKRLTKRLRDDGSAVLLSTHVLEVAEGLCDTFVILNHGRVVGRGTLAELRKQVPEARNLEEAFLALTGGIPPE
ncbi:MAG: ATP-binding cassette domain-containing protein [Candidatus Thorarchaeota archaeon]|nr:ATP-binding cassette domain-containing protein [Candidatus Thorarchaeota archaeon]